MSLLNKINKTFMKTNLPDFNVGDTVCVSLRIIEGEKSRFQEFEGIVISQKSWKSFHANFTVRRISFGEGVEKIFPLHSPRLASIKVLRKGLVRRAKLYYLRDRIGRKATHVKEKVTHLTKKK